MGGQLRQTVVSCQCSNQTVLNPPAVEFIDTRSCDNLDFNLTLCADGGHEHCKGIDKTIDFVDAQWVPKKVRLSASSVEVSEK
jgi:hypothetical protein